ncbi:hypothetical protein [Actinocorallia longicatena]|uniref:Uncharacterized protein n=1 Tax=Actinocorallia longicatena TaxID=111803 RepID=A0ABP6Q728_9ACTN
MTGSGAAGAARERVEAVGDDLGARLGLATAFYRDGIERYGRAELGFLRWEIARGVLDPADGSPWWRAVNDRLLRDKTEAALLEAGTRGPASGPSVALWRRFLRAPSPAAWYLAHNSSIVGGYLVHEDLAERELPAERFMINVALLRVLYTHALVAWPRLALGRLAALGPRLGDPRGRSVGAFLDLRNSFPQDYPLTGGTVTDVARQEGVLAQILDHGVIVPRLRRLYAVAASELPEPRLAALLRPDGVPCYADPAIDGSVFVTPRRLARVATLVTVPR